MARKIVTTVSLPWSLVVRIARYSEKNRIKRSEAMRILIEKGLNSEGE